MPWQSVTPRPPRKRALVQQFYHYFQPPLCCAMFSSSRRHESAFSHVVILRCIGSDMLEMVVSVELSWYQKAVNDSQCKSRYNNHEVVVFARYCQNTILILKSWRIVDLYLLVLNIQFSAQTSQTCVVYAIHRHVALKSFTSALLNLFKKDQCGK